MQEHTLLGLLFWRDEVLLVRRARPIWQFNMLTGLETTVRSGETVWSAMARELREKSGYAATGLDWRWYATLSYRDGSVKVLFATAPPEESRPHLTSHDPTEPFEWVSRLVLPGGVQENLRWLVPLAQDKALCHRAEVNYDSAVMKASRRLPVEVVGKRYFVVTRAGSSFCGTVSEASGDSVTLTDVVFADDSDKPEVGATIIVRDDNLDVFLRAPLSERQILLVTERMLQLGSQTTGKK